MIFTPHKESIGTICFLSYNRGNILLKTIKELLPKISNRWPVLIADNASTKYFEEYKEIEQLASKSDLLFYFKHKKNGHFEGNLLSLFDLAPTQFFIVVSDEDMPSIEALAELAPFLAKNRDIGGVRTSLGTVPGVPRGQAHTWKTQLFK